MAMLAPLRTKAEDALLREGEELPQTPARQSALKAFNVNGLPHRRIEEWKYTDVRAFWREPLPRAAKPDAAMIEKAKAIGPQPENALVDIVNGFFVGSSDLPAGIFVTPLDRLGDKAATQLTGWSDAALTLNSAFNESGVLIRIAAHKTLDKPLHINCRYAGAPSASYPRIVIEVGEGAQVNILETHVSKDDTYANNGVVIVYCADKAVLNHTRVQVQSAKTLNIVSTLVDIGEDATYKAFALEEGAALSRNQYFIRQSGENGNIDLSGITLAKDRQHLDTTLVVDHTVPHGTSREMFRQVLMDEARGVFQGKIIVRQHAQKTDGQMHAKGLLLNEGPEFDAKPELEIYADDVVCAHGATAGELDEDLLFYLRARGLPEGEAKAMLVSAFVGIVLEKVEFEPMRQAIAARCERWLKEALH